jgi:hypothetical protein
MSWVFMRDQQPLPIRKYSINIRHFEIEPVTIVIQTQYCEHRVYYVVADRAGSWVLFQTGK